MDNIASPPSKQPCIENCEQIPVECGNQNIPSHLQVLQNHLQKLKLVNHYRKNHSLEELSTLKKQWTAAAQQALQDLQTHLQDCGQDTPMQDLLNHLGIDPKMVQYSVDAEEFTELG